MQEGRKPSRHSVFECTLGISHCVRLLILRTLHRGHRVNQMQSGTTSDKRVTRLVDGGEIKLNFLSDSEWNLKLHPIT